MRPTTSILVILLLAPVSVAAGDHELSGTLAVQRERFVGEAAITTWQGALDLAPAVKAGDEPMLLADEGLGKAVETSWLSLAGEVARELGSGTRDLVLPSGTYRMLACDPGCQILLVPAGGTVGLAGAVSGPLETRSTEAGYCGDYCADGPDDFAYFSQPGDLLVGPGGTPVARAEAVVEGRLRLFLYGVLVEHVDASGAVERLDLRADRSQTAPLVTDSGIIRTRYAIVTLDAHGLEGDAAQMLLMGDRLDVALQGSFVADEATGTLDVGGRPVRADGEPVHLEGDLTLSVHGSAPSLLAPEKQRDVNVEGRATMVRVGAATVRPVAATEGVLPTTLALALLALALVGLYSRIRRDRIFDNANRARIADLLRSRPGLTSREIAAALDLARVVVQHHLVILLAHRFVMRQRVGRADRYHVVDVPLDRGALERERALRDPTRRRIAELVASRAGVTQSDVAAALGVSQRLVSYHLRRLESTGLVKSEGQSPRRYAACGDLAGSRLEER